MKRGLNRNQLKYLVILAMVVDHVAWAFVPLLSRTGQAMHFFGRLTGPAMAFFIAEGYLHTRDVKKYAGRLALFALLSWPAFSYFETGKWFTPHFGVIYTLLLGLLAVWIWDKAPVHPLLRLVPIAALVWLSRWGRVSHLALSPLPLALVGGHPQSGASCGAAAAALRLQRRERQPPPLPQVVFLRLLSGPSADPGPAAVDVRKNLKRRENRGKINKIIHPTESRESIWNIWKMRKTPSNASAY